MSQKIEENKDGTVSVRVAGADMFDDDEQDTLQKNKSIIDQLKPAPFTILKTFTSRRKAPPPPTPLTPKQEDNYNNNNGSSNNNNNNSYYSSPPPSSSTSSSNITSPSFGSPSSSQENDYDGGFISKPERQSFSQRKKQKTVSNEERVQMAQKGQQKQMQSVQPATAKSRAKTSNAISLDDLLMQKKERKPEQEVISYDEMINQQNETKKKISESDLIDKEDYQKLSKVNERKRQKKILSYLLLKARPDLMMTENPNQMCIKEKELELPKVLSLSKVLDSNYIPASKAESDLIQVFKNTGERTPFKYFILNGLDYLVGTFDTIPKFLLDLLFSYICFEKDELTVYKSYLILSKSIKNSKTILLPFQSLVDVLQGHYKINTDQTFNATKPSNESTSNSSASTTAATEELNNMDKQPKRSFPFTNLYYILTLLKEQSHQFKSEELKHLILFICLLCLDPNFRRSNQQDMLQDFIEDVDLKQKQEQEQKESATNLALGTTILQILLLLPTLLNTLIVSFYNTLTVEQSADDTTITLFDDIWSSLDEKYIYSLSTIVSYVLPCHGKIKHPIKIDLQRKFALYSILKILNNNNIKEIISKKSSMVEELVVILRPFVQQIKDDTIDVLKMLNLIVLVDICSNSRKELNELKRKDKMNPFEQLIVRWSGKIKESKDAIDFNRTRMKDGLVSIQSKLAALIIDNTSTNSFLSSFFIQNDPTAETKKESLDQFIQPIVKSDDPTIPRPEQDETPMEEEKVEQKVKEEKVEQKMEEEEEKVEDKINLTQAFTDTTTPTINIDQNMNGGDTKPPPPSPMKKTRQTSITSYFQPISQSGKK
ncbi:hypothetical protein DFA_12242 [Cavenderia fasciculata]|uniref:Uncharacterized protein n=1 Tax=Cavenderia fasciculata TaxID=261658 RepID=F4QCU6_CACFS|nr:uncharacterized protein DFA_12242 [Cavenderia fasciculata]EGG14470.1 hypothetical protein DFA_12242 [Cavenderia fasciculata]|eukprot:XP_004353879.1 hypothetical protein DFA_12242 [Cavenderia fasciculata]